MEIDAIIDGKTLERWLNARPKVTRQSAAIVLAFRAACRVMPIYIYGRAMGLDWISKREVTALPILRCLLTAEVARTYPTPEVKAAAAAAATFAAAHAAAAHAAAAHAAAAHAAHAAAVAAHAAAATFAAYVAAHAAHAATFAADAAAAAALATTAGTTAAARAARAAATRAAWEQIKKECRALDQGQDPDTLPLWQGADNPLLPAWLDTRALWQHAAPAYDFWLRWYQALLDATPLPPALLRDIALIPDADWLRGAEHVAKLIADLSPGSPLANAALVDFDFDAALRRLEIIGFNDDMAHLKDPATVAAFLDDMEEAEAGLQDFLDYSEAAHSGNNALAVLGVATEKILTELRRTRDKTHIRARRVISLAADLFVFSTEGDKRAQLGDGLCRKLETNIALLRTACRKHLAVAILKLEPLDRLELGDQNPEELVAQLRAAIDKIIGKANGSDLARFSPEAKAVLNDLLNDVVTLETALTGAESEGAKRNLRGRFVKSYGAVAATVGKALERAKMHADTPIKAFDRAVRVYKRWETLENIVNWFKDLKDLF